VSGEAYVLDHTALVALGSGHRMLSRLVHAAHREADRHLQVPALCLAAAVAERAALADHVGSLPAVDVVELAYSAAAMVGRLVAGGVDWRTAHAVHVARPDAEWPNGRPVVTLQPRAYAGHGVRTIAVHR
jgi:hypothetical protein